MHLVRERPAGNCPLRINENGKYYVIEDMAVVVGFLKLYTAAVRNFGSVTWLHLYIFLLNSSQNMSLRRFYTRIQEGRPPDVIGLYHRRKKALENSSITKILLDQIVLTFIKTPKECFGNLILATCAPSTVLFRDSGCRTKFVV